MLFTDRQIDRQTNQHYQKHTLLCQGDNFAKEVIKSAAGDWHGGKSGGGVGVGWG